MDSAANRPASKWAVYSSLALNFFAFAILLNTVGIVIARALDDYRVDPVLAGTLDPFKDVSIMLASLLLAPLVPLIGYRRAMVAGLLAVTVASLATASIATFWILPLLYVAIGTSFALTKVSVYSTVGFMAKDPRRHTLLINTLEGVFQVGAMTGPLIFSLMIAAADWRDTYWILAAITSVALVLALRIKFPAGAETDPKAERRDAGEKGLRTTLRLLRLPMVWVFALCAFFYVMIEQSFGTWLPTFHQQVFGLTPAAAAGLLSLYAGSIAAGRFVFGAVALRVPWIWLLLALLLAALWVTGTIVATTSGESPAPVGVWYEAPLSAFALSAVGLFLGPIYPTIVSAVLGRLEPSRHSAMTGLIIVFSALGGATGSFIVGVLSRSFSTHDAFFFPLLPMAALAALLLPYNRLIRATPAPRGEAHAP